MHSLKNLSLFLAVWLLSINLSAQIDSLEQILNTTSSDSVKIKTCFELYGLYSLNDPEKARNIIDQAYKISEESNYERGIILCYDKWGGIEMMNSNYPKAIEYYTMADSLLQRMEWPRQQAVIYGNLAGIYKDKGEFDKALEWNEKFMEIAEKLGNPVFMGFGKGIHGDIYHIKGHFSLAAKYQLESLRNYEEAADSGRIADGCLKVGQAHLYGDRYDDAEKYLKKAQRIYSSINDLYFWVDASEALGYLEVQRKNYSAAAEYYDTADSLAQILGVDYAKAQALDGKVDVAYGLGNYAEALRINEESMALFKQLENNYEYGWACSKKARALHKLNRNTEALQANSQSEAIFTEYDITSGLKATHQNFYNIYKSQGDFPSALASLEDYMELNDSLVNAQSKTQIEELQIIYDTEKREQELNLIKAENELLKSKSEIEGLKKQRMWWLIVGLIFLGAVIIFWQYQSYLKNKRIAHEKAKRQTAELEAQKVEKEQIERELASHVLQLCQQNELLMSVKDKVSLLAPEAGEKSHGGLKSIERELNFGLQNKESWTQFLSTFEKVHPDFLTRLVQKAEKLSPAEQRLACLIKMNLSSKQMASILCISTEGIKKARYRLRKKLQLDSAVNLTEYLMVA